MNPHRWGVVERVRRTASWFLRSAERRAILYQVAIIGVVLATLHSVVERAVELLAAHRVKPGFDFLSDRAGFHGDERIVLPRFDPEFFLFAGSVAAGLLAAWGLSRWAARRGTPVAADTRLAVLRMALLFGIPAAALAVTGSGIGAEQLTSESTFRQALAIGILNTLRVSGVALVLCTIVGMIVALMRLSPNWVLRTIGRAYVELVRNIPLLPLLFFWLAVVATVPPDRQSLSRGDVTFIDNRGVYLPAVDSAPGLTPFCIAVGSALFLVWLAARAGREHMERTGRRVPVIPICLALVFGLPGTAVLMFGPPLTYTLPVLEGFNIRDAIALTPTFVALVVAMAVYYGAYVAEIIRTGILSVSSGGVEAEHSGAPPTSEAVRLAVLPLALREIIPPMVSRYSGLIKSSSLGVAVGYPEIVSVGNDIGSATGKSIEILVLIMAFYLCISLSVSIWLNWYKRQNPVEVHRNRGAGDPRFLPVPPDLHEDIGSPGLGPPKPAVALVERGPNGGCPVALLPRDFRNLRLVGPGCGLSRRPRGLREHRGRVLAFRGGHLDALSDRCLSRGRALGGPTRASCCCSSSPSYRWRHVDAWASAGSTRCGERLPSCWWRFCTEGSGSA